MKIDTPQEAREALAIVAQHGTPDEQAQVRAEVKRKFPAVHEEGNGRSATFEKRVKTEQNSRIHR